MRITRTGIRLALTTALILLPLTACNFSSPNPTTLNLSVADTPVDGATSVQVAFTGVQIQPANGALQEYDFSFPESIDLLERFQDGFQVILGDQPVPAGHYLWVRLMMDMSRSSITLTDGSVHPLVLTGSDQTGIKFVSGFDVSSEQASSFTVDFDLRKSIALVSGDYDFTPVMRLVDDDQVATLAGIVSNTFMIGTTAVTDPTCSPAAYIYAGANIKPVDINPTSKVQPLATATVFLDDFTGDYKYFADFMLPGTYTVALVCAAGDDPTKTDTLTFAEPQTAPVSTGYFTEVDFP